MATAGKVTLEVRTHASGLIFDPVKCPDCGIWWRGVEHECPKAEAPLHCNSWHTCPMCRETWSGLPHKCKRVVRIPDGLEVDMWTYEKRPGGDETTVTWKTRWPYNQREIDQFNSDIMGLHGK